MQHVSVFGLGQRVDVVRGGFTLRNVPVSTVTFFQPDEAATILGSNNPTEGEHGVRYTVTEEYAPHQFRDRVVWAWMMEPLS